MQKILKSIAPDDISPFSLSLAKRLNTCNIKVTENCTYWKPAAVISDNEYYIGRAINQYFVQEKITSTTNSTIWLSYDIIKNELCCMKVYYIVACMKERSVRFFKEDTEVITLLDKIIDEMLYHCSLYKCPGVSKVNEIIVNLNQDIIYFIMSYYPSQLLYYDCHDQCYYGPCSKSLYNELGAKHILKELIYTVKYLHDNGIIHKDIKPENILLKKIEYNLFDIQSSDQSSKNNSYSSTIIKKLPSNDVNAVKLCKRNYDFITNLEPPLLNTLDEYLLKHFPYNPLITSDFDWNLWDDVDLTCDWITSENSIQIGRNSYNYANHLYNISIDSCFDVFNYFISETCPIPYRINPKFVKNSELDDTEYKYPTNEFVVITDFGVTSLAYTEDGDVEKLAIYDSEGTLAFISPESLKYMDGSISAREHDVYSLGVTLYCMIYGKLPYYGNNSIQLLVNMLEEPLNFGSNRIISPELKSLLSEMLDMNYKNRISLDEILRHPWMINT